MNSHLENLTFPSAIGHHTNWGVNAVKLLDYKPKRVTTSERLRLKRSIKQGLRKGKKPYKTPPTPTASKGKHYIPAERNTY